MKQIFDYFNKKETPDIILANPYLKDIAPLNACFNLENTLRYNAISELSFDFPESLDNGKTILPSYDKIKNKMVVKVMGIGNYIINSCPEDTSGGVAVKHVNCQSLESELLYRKTIGISGTFNFYEEGMEGTIIDILKEKIPGWFFGYIDPSLENIYRTFEAKDTNIYNFMTDDLSKAYGCFFIFDTINKNISVYAIGNVGQQTNIFFNFNNISKDIKLEEFSDELATKLYCYGGEGLGIYSVNPLGGNAIYNFSYFKGKNEWMDEDLEDAVNGWETKVEGSQYDYANYSLQRNELLTEAASQEITLSESKNVLEALKTVYVNMLAAEEGTFSGSEIGLSYLDFRNQRVAVEEGAKVLAILQEDIDNLNATITEIVYSLKFTEKEVWSSFFSSFGDPRLGIRHQISDILASWKSIYYETASALGFDRVQLDASSTLISSISEEIKDKMGDLYVKLYTIDLPPIESFSITEQEIDKVQGMIYELINSLENIYNIFSGLIANTEITISLRTNIIKLRNYIGIIGSYTENFTRNQFLNLQTLMYENTYVNENITINTLMSEKEVQARAQYLYDQSLTVMERVSQPRYEFSGNFVNFLFLPEYAHFIDELELGKTIRIEMGNGEVVSAALLEIQYKYENPQDSSFVLSNRIKLNSSNFKFADMFIASTKGGGTVSGITAGEAVSTTSATSMGEPVTPQNIFNDAHSIISALGYISFGITPPESYGNNQGVWLGWDGQARVSLYSGDNDYFQWDGTRLLVKARNFTLDQNGNITATSANLSGKITALTGSIGGWEIDDDSISSDQIWLKSYDPLNQDSSPYIKLGNAQDFMSGCGVFLGKSDGVYKLHIGDPLGGVISWSGTTLATGGWETVETGFTIGSGDNTVTLSSAGGVIPSISAGAEDTAIAPFRVYPNGDLFASNANISGSVTATSGSIGGWIIDELTIHDTSGSTGLSSSSTLSRNVRFWAGGTDPSTALFRVYDDGTVYAENAEISGSVTATDIQATEGTIGGWIIEDTELFSYDPTDGYYVGMNSDVQSGPAFYAGALNATYLIFPENYFPDDYWDEDYITAAVVADSNTAPFRVYVDGSLVASSASITGTINALSGNIGGWIINSNTIESPSGGIALNSNTSEIIVGNETNAIIIDGTDIDIHSANYASGTSGFSMSGNTGNAEFNNIVARGEIRTSVFSYDEVTSTAGSLGVFKSAGILMNDVTIASTFSIDIEDPKAMTVKAPIFEIGDIIEMKGVTGQAPVVASDTWAIITGYTSNTGYYTYQCTLQSGSVGVVYLAGQSVIDYGDGAEGFLIMTSGCGADGPHYSVKTSGSEPWGENELSTMQEHVRLGNLAGFLGFSPDENTYGIGIGTALGNHLSYDTSSSQLKIKGSIIIEGGDDTSIPWDSITDVPDLGSGPTIFYGEVEDFTEISPPISFVVDMGDILISESSGFFYKAIFISGSVVTWEQIENSTVVNSALEITNILNNLSILESKTISKISTNYSNSIPNEYLTGWPGDDDQICIYSASSIINPNDEGIYITGSQVGDFFESAELKFRYFTSGCPWEIIPVPEGEIVDQKIYEVPGDIRNRVGDLWYDTSVNILYMYNIVSSGSFEISGSQVDSYTYGFTPLNVTQNVIDMISLEPNIFYSSYPSEKPSSWNENDLWINTTGSGVYIASASSTLSSDLSVWKITDVASAELLNNLSNEVFSMSDDGIISSLEKMQALKEWWVIVGEANCESVYSGSPLGAIYSAASSLMITLESGELYDSASVATASFCDNYTNLYTYLNGLDIFNPDSGSIACVRENWDSTWISYYNYKSNLLNVMTDITSKISNWDLIDKPSGLDIFSPPDVVGLYIDSTHMGYCEIDDLGIEWKVYIDNTGSFILGNPDDDREPGIIWDNTSLTIRQADLIMTDSNSNKTIEINPGDGINIFPFISVGSLQLENDMFNLEQEQGGVWMGQAGIGDYRFFVGNKTSSIYWDDPDLSIHGVTISLGNERDDPRLKIGMGGENNENPFIAMGEEGIPTSYDDDKPGIYMGRNIAEISQDLLTESGETLETEAGEALVTGYAQYVFRVGAYGDRYLAWSGSTLEIEGAGSISADNLTIDEYSSLEDVDISGSLVITGDSGSVVIYSDVDIFGNLIASGSSYLSDVNISGSLIVGEVTLGHAPTSGSNPATKAYVDSKTTDRNKNIWISGWRPNVNTNVTACGDQENFQAGTYGSYSYLPFNTEEVTYAFSTIPMPLDFDSSSSSIQATVYWTQPTSSSGTVIWEIGIISFAANTSLGTSPSSFASISASTGGSALYLYKTEKASIDIYGTPEAGELISFHIRRSTSDTLDIDAYLLGVMIEYDII